MDEYVARYVCKLKEESTIPRQYSYGFGLQGKNSISILVINTYSNFEIGKEYTIIISE